MRNTIRYSDLKDDIIKSLNSKMSEWKIKCSSCWSKEMTLIDWISKDLLQDDTLWGLVLWWPTLPKILLVCSDCANINYYALKALLPNKDI
jgi:hypothetical protein